MIRERTEIAILGAGFAGSLMALVLRRIGRPCVLIERGTHPRFAIGESSTPTANLTLDSLCQKYSLPRVAPLTKYGRWQSEYPSIACGLKRGFSFFQHQRGRDFLPTANHDNELLVGASPTDELGDTHWYREEVDHFFVREAQAEGIPYFDRTEIVSLERANGWQLIGKRDEEDVSISASFLIDATGPSGLLARTLGIATDPTKMHTNSWSIYSHFMDVELWQDLLGEMNARTADYPYPCDAAALHHVLADGWMWVLRFNNGVTSAGLAFDGERHPHVPNLDPEIEWQTALRDYPSLARQFAKARRIRPWSRTGRMQRHSRQVAGADWAMLPHAAYFFDPLFSAGNAHTLLGIERLARVFDGSPSACTMAEPLAEYERKLFREIEFLDWLIHGCYRAFGRFDLLSSYLMYYFAGAVQSEISLRSNLVCMAGSPERRTNDGFLFSEHDPFRAAVRASYQLLAEGSARSGIPSVDGERFARRVAGDIGAINPTGFCDPAKLNMYPFVA